MQTPLRLNLGCAKDIRSGFINVDLHYKHPDVINEDISNLSFIENESVTEILAKDVIEHLPLEVSLNCLEKWYKWLKPEGILWIQTTNFEKIKEAYDKNVWDLKVLNHMLFSGVNWIDGKSENCDFHKSVYTLDFLNKELSRIGYTTSQSKIDEIDSALMHDPYCHNLNLIIKAKK